MLSEVYLQSFVFINNKNVLRNQSSFNLTHLMLRVATKNHH